MTAKKVFPGKKIVRWNHNESWLFQIQNTAMCTPVIHI